MKRLVIGHWSLLIGLIATALSLSSCRNDIVYCQFMPISSEKWEVDSVAQFDYSIEDTKSNYRMLIYVRHTERYPYQNMWLFVDDNGHRDTIEFYLADDRGQWLGNRHHGVMEMPVLWEDTRQYADTGHYSLTIRHGMRDTLLRGITDIGLEIVKQ
jgi:gliding motility-associated lipoprotein GldH